MDDILRDEHPFTFIDGPLSLQTLASVELALILWRRKYFSHSPSRTETVDSFLKKVFSCIEVFAVPSRIKDIIDARIISVGEELKKWIEFYSKEALFDEDFRTVFLKYFDCIVMKPNGKISLESTAMNILKSDELDDVVKYKLACTFCLESEVRRIWPSVRNDSRVTGDAVIKSNLMFHWNCRMKSRKDPVSAYSRFNQSLRNRNWAALRYFWDHLKESQRIPRAFETLRCAYIDATICILPKLNKIEARTVFEAKTCEILSILVPNHEYIEHVLVLWSHMVDVITEEVFLNIVRGLWKMTWNPGRVGPNRRYRVDGMLLEIWTSAPDRLKSYVLNNHKIAFFDRLHLQGVGFSRYYGHDMEFMLNLLKNSTFEFRNEIWWRNWKKLVLRAKPLYVEQFLKLCLSNDKQIEHFKLNQIADFKRLFTLLLEQGFYSEVADYLNFCFNDPNRVNNECKRVLRSNIGTIISTLLDDDKLAKFDSFVCGIFPNADDVAEFKENLICSAQSLKTFQYLFNRIDFENFKKIVVYFSTSEKQLNKMKLKILEYCRDYVKSTSHWVDFTVHRWENLLNWCVANEEEKLAFKQTLNIDEIFRIHFTNHCCCKRWYWSHSKYEGVFFFENFSKWYFDSEEARRRFKLDVINNYEENHTILWVLDHETPSVIFKMLNWFFDGDSEMIQKFQDKLKETEIPNRPETPYLSLSALELNYSAIMTPR